MYCPLCLAEYRQGFTACSECKVNLVPTHDEGEARRMRFWKGEREEKLDRILQAFADADVPYHFRESPNFNGAVRTGLTIFGVGFGKKRAMLNYEVWIFRSDLQRAQKAVAHLLHEQELRTE
jgi:hypothetical protein